MLLESEYSVFLNIKSSFFSKEERNRVLIESQLICAMLLPTQTNTTD